MSGIATGGKKNLGSFYQQGPKGDDAYVVAVSQGFGGTKAEWLASLHGADSTVPGPPGYTPRKGIDYFDGIDGHTPVKGVDYFDGAASTVPGPAGYTPVKGVDYFDGSKGDKGDTPVKGVDYFDGVTQDISGKVDKVTGKGLSSNDYTDAEKSKLAGLDAGADANVQPDWNEADSGQDDYIKNKPTIPSTLSSLSDDSTHRLVTDVNIAAWNAKADNNLAIAMAIAL